MWKQTARFVRLPTRQKAIASEAAGFVILASCLVRLLSLPRTLQIVDRILPDCRSAGGTPPEESLDSVSWAVTGVTGTLPWSVSCLARAVSARTMLRRRGFQAQLRIGVRPAPGQADRASGIAAHSWVEAGGRVVVGDGPNLSEISRFPPFP